MKEFHALTVARLERETKDSVRIALSVPVELHEQFEFLPGQHLPIPIVRGGKKMRRTYSICSEFGALPLAIGVRVQPEGSFSELSGQ